MAHTISRRLIEQGSLPVDFGYACEILSEGLFPNDSEQATYTAFSLALLTQDLMEGKAELPPCLRDDQIEDWVAGCAVTKVLKIWKYTDNFMASAGRG